MYKTLVLSTLLSVTSLPCFAGTLVFEAEEEQEIVVESNNASRTDPAHIKTTNIRCRLPNGRVALLSVMACKQQR